MNKTANALHAAWVNPRLVWDRVGKEGACWPWQGHRNADGYGDFTAGGASVLAHRAAYFIAAGYLCMNDCIRHTCDNPACCNPAHLVAGTHAENMADMKAKGRRKGVGTGQNNGRAKLTRREVEDIRAERVGGLTLRALASRYGVGMSTISRVVRRENWNG